MFREWHGWVELEHERDTSSYLDGWRAIESEKCNEPVFSTLADNVNILSRLILLLREILSPHGMIQRKKIHEESTATANKFS